MIETISNLSVLKAWAVWMSPGRSHQRNPRSTVPGGSSMRGKWTSAPIARLSQQPLLTAFSLHRIKRKEDRIGSERRLGRRTKVASDRRNKAQGLIVFIRVQGQEVAAVPFTASH